MMNPLGQILSDDIWEHKIKHFLYGKPKYYVHPGEKEFGDDFRMCACCRKKIFKVKEDKHWGDHWDYETAGLYLQNLYPFAKNSAIVEVRDIEICCSEKCVKETEGKLRYNYNENSIEPVSRVLEFKKDFRPIPNIFYGKPGPRGKFAPRYLNYTDKPYERGPHTAAIEVMKTEVCENIF
jgi:hypothetical protein